MARFLDLPEELILGIITFIQPEDLENFAQTCPRIHSVAGSALEKHRLLIRQYSTMKNKGSRTISKTLKEVLVNPEIGRYIWNFSLDYIGGTQRNFSPKYSTDDLELFMPASANSEFLSPCGQIPLACYKSLIERGNEDILLAILLPLLPNLRSLKFSRVSNDGDRCWTNHMFSYLPHVNTPTLTRLSTIYINIGGIYFSLDEAKAYANVPSVNSLSAFRLCCGNQSHASLLSTPNSNITKLELWECRVPSKPLHDFLLGFHSLQSFAYSCDLPEHLADKFDVFLIRSALLANARKSLRKLTILACQRRSSVMGTLRPFEVLEEVCTDWRLLLPVNLVHGPKMRLAMSLPNSLQRLDLHDGVCRGARHHSDLVNNAVRAQNRGTHVKPQPHEDLAQFEWGLQLQYLTITCGTVPVASPWWADDSPDAKGSDKWYRDCEKDASPDVKGSDERYRL